MAAAMRVVRMMDMKIVSWLFALLGEERTDRYRQSFDR
jgi:hypothetical protein